MNNNFYKAVGERINTLLAVQNKKQKELAEYLGVKDNVVSYFVSGNRKPNIKQIKQIAEFFNTSSDYLLGLSDAKITATEDEQIKTVCDYLEIDEFALDILKSQIHDDRFSVLLKNRALLFLPLLFNTYHDKVLEALEEIKKADKAIMNGEEEKAKGHINNYLILHELMDSLEMKITRTAEGIYYRENAELLEKLEKIKSKQQIEKMLEESSISDLYETVKYKGE